MSVTMGGAGVAVVGLKQKSTAASKSYRVILGWKPAWIWFMKSDNSANGRMAFAVDGEFDANSTGTHRGAAMKIAGGSHAAGDGQFVDLGSDGVLFYENGFQIGQDGFFKDDGVKIWCVCYRSIVSPTAMIDLDDAPALKDDFGKGEQFKIDAKTYGGIEVYEV